MLFEKELTKNTFVEFDGEKYKIWQGGFEEKEVETPAIIILIPTIAWELKNWIEDVETVRGLTGLEQELGPELWRRYQKNPVLLLNQLSALRKREEGK